MVDVYIDHPDTLESYIFRSGEKYGDDVVSRKIGVKVEFICNSLGGISKGDVYRIPFETAEDATMFMLKGEYKIIPNSIVEEYKLRNLYK